MPILRLPLCALALSAAVVAQTTAVIPCVQDNTLYEDPSGLLSNATGSGLFVGLTATPEIRRALVQFDVAASVPAGARILEAHLGITVTRTIVGTNFNAFAHRVLAPWGEGTSLAPGQQGGGGAATANDATWLHRFYNTQLWTNPGGDFALPHSAVIDTPSLGPASSAFSPALVADVQDMLDHPSGNFGWLLKTDETASSASRRIGSRESTTPPTLTVTYMLPGQSATWGAGCLVNGTNFVHQILGAPAPNNIVQLQQQFGPASSPAANLLAVGFHAAGYPLLPQCNLYLPLLGGISTYNILLLDAAGTGSTPFTVPVGFPGLLIASQSAALTPTGGFVLSNAALLVLQ